MVTLGSMGIVRAENKAVRRLFQQTCPPQLKLRYIIVNHGQYLALSASPWAFSYPVIAAIGDILLVIIPNHQQVPILSGTQIKITAAPIPRLAYVVAHPAFQASAGR